MIFIQTIFKYDQSYIHGTYVDTLKNVEQDRSLEDAFWGVGWASLGGALCGDAGCCGDRAVGSGW